VAAEALVQLFHVFKQYSGEAPALADVTIEVGKGEFVFLTGPSGAGKSTLLKLIFCAEPATGGQLLVFGRNVAKIRPSQIPFLRRTIGVVFQDFKLLPYRTVYENVAFPLEVRGLAPKEVSRKVGAMLRSVGLELKAGKFPLSLSGGEQQRVAVARALVGDPALLLADEPTGNLDPERTLEVMDLIQAASARGTTVVVATHDRSLLERYKRRVIALEAGRVVSDGDAFRRMAEA
jgi:cell division transport system ATP-binding protein